MALAVKAQYTSSLRQIRLYRDSLYPYTVRAPGPGTLAPKLDLRSTAGRRFDLASYLGRQRVLLFFQKRLNWTQIRAIQRDAARFRAVAIGPIVAVAAGPIDKISERVISPDASTPVLADPDGTVSNSYSAPRTGQTFVLVGKDGRIVWRADYKKRRTSASTVPVDVLLDQLKIDGKNS